MQISSALRPCQASDPPSEMQERIIMHFNRPAVFVESNATALMGRPKLVINGARKNITCLEQSKRIAPTTRRNVSGRRVQEAKELFGESASAPSPGLRADASTSQITRHSNLDSLPISPQEVGILSRDYFDSIFPVESHYEELTSYKMRSATIGWDLCQMSSLDQIIACFSASYAALLAYNIPIQLPFYPQEQQCIGQAANSKATHLCGKINSRAGRVLFDSFNGRLDCFVAADMRILGPRTKTRQRCSPPARVQSRTPISSTSGAKQRRPTISTHGQLTVGMR